VISLKKTLNENPSKQAKVFIVTMKRFFDKHKMRYKLLDANGDSPSFMFYDKQWDSDLYVTLTRQGEYELLDDVGKVRVSKSNLNNFIKALKAPNILKLLSANY